MNRTILNITIFIFIVTLIISDAILDIFSIPSQVLLFLPLLAICVLNFRYNNTLYTTICIFLYGLVLVLNGLNSSPDNATLVMYRYFGNALVLYPLINSFYSTYIIEKMMKYYFVLCSIVGCAFFIGLWENNSGRYTFMSHNSNGAASIICIGVLFALYYLFQAKTARERNRLLLLIAAMSIPILLTISRSGISCLLCMFIVYAAFKLRRSIMTTSLLAILAVVSFAVINVEDVENSTVQSINKRFNETKNDPRHEWRRRGFEIINENIIYGVGYDNYLSDDWLFESGFYKERAGEFIISSIHNGYVDLGLLGGYPLILLYLMLTVPWLIWGIRIYFSNTADSEAQATGVVFISFFYIIFITTYTGQAIYAKQTWWILAICFVLLRKIRTVKPKTSVKSLTKEELHLQIKQLANK